MHANRQAERLATPYKHEIRIDSNGMKWNGERIQNLLAHLSYAHLYN